MILADKIIELRKRSGWSQEELAGRLGVSRQAVSKWESAASIPDLDKILKLSQLFGVSTDTLLKDELDLSSPALDQAPPPAEDTLDPPPRQISLEAANAYLDTVRAQAGKLALGVALCILSPVVLILLGGLSDHEGGYRIPENLAGGVGTTVLFLLVAGAVTLFILYGRKMEPYETWERDPVELAYGVTGVVEKAKAQYEGRHTLLLVAGVALCILSVVPLMLAAAVAEDGMILIAAVDLLLLLVAAGVYLLVKTCTRFGAFQLLLEQGDYTRSKKREERQNDAISTIYWCAVTAVYLAWSFLTMNWHITWVVWPVAGVLYGVVEAILALRRKKN